MTLDKLKKKEKEISKHIATETVGVLCKNKEMAKEMSNLYYIENQGCHDTTCGLARISDEDFPKFKEIIENLNKNSYCGCMPTIQVWRIDEKDIQEVEVANSLYAWKNLRLDGKIYELVLGYSDLCKLDTVIG